MRNARKVVFSVALVVGLLASTAAMAQQSGYAQAGCGLGSMIFGSDRSIVKQVLAATTNGIFANQTFGITTGTSNCGAPAGIAMTPQQFVETNREVLAKDIARGSGETINALARVAGCKQTDQVGPTLQKEYKNIFPTAGVSDVQVGHNVIQSLKSNSQLSCENAG